MADKPLTQEQLQALQAMGAGAAFTFAAPFGITLPFQNYLSDKSKVNIKQQEAMRMFPQADPNLFNTLRGGYTPYLGGDNSQKTIIPLNTNIADERIFNRRISSLSPLSASNIYEGSSFYPTYLNAQPGSPSPELGSYAQVVTNKTIFPEGDIQAITVTPGPNPSRFSQDYSEILADKLGKAHHEYERFISPSGPYHTNKNTETIKELNRLENKIGILSDKTPGTAGYVWGNTERPQYSYAEGNWGLGQKEVGSNPAIYLSRINADPLKEADYLYTGNILDGPYKEPRARFRQYEDLGYGTGPSWGIAPNEDISFRKDLIGARGELTVGDLQALLAERNLPFAYQSYTKTPDRTVVNSNGISVLLKGENTPTQRSGDILKNNLQRLADAEGMTPAQTAERFARLVPSVGEPSTPSTPAVTGRQGEFPSQSQAASPFGSFAAKTDLRQVGILPPSDKANYSPFTFDDFNLSFRHIYPRYNASNLREITPSRVVPALPGSIFEEDFIPGTYELTINRDALRPQAANKLLNRTVDRLIQQAEPIKGLGLGGFAAGGIATAMDPQVIDALSQGDYLKAGSTAAINTAIGSTVGGATAKGLQALQAAGYARPAAVISQALPLAGGVLAGLGMIETGQALNRVYRAQTGRDWATRNQVPSSYPRYTGPTPEIRPRMGTAILNGRPVQVPYGSVAGERRVGRPWWDVAGSKFQDLMNRFNAGSIIGR